MAHNTIGNIKDILNEKNKIVERKNWNLIEYQQNMVQESLNMVAKITWMNAAIPLKVY